uniref:Uncharacterized protein n=1 Tax=Acrobeloides nanus TaxID=290746 RepID=A0A914D782_9BILA
MTSKVQLDRDVISGIWKHNLTPRLINSSDDDDENSDDTDGSKGRFDIDVSNFKLGLVSKKCFLALKTSCDEEFKGAILWDYPDYEFQVIRNIDDDELGPYKISEPVFWLLKEWGLCELQFNDGNNNNNYQRYLQVLRKIKGFGLKSIDFAWSYDSDSEFCGPDHLSEMLRIISESSCTLKELCDVPDIFLPHLPHTLKLEKLVACLKSTSLNSNIKDFLQLSAKEVVIKAKDCYLPSHLLKNINAQTLHVDVSRSWAEGIEEKILTYKIFFNFLPSCSSRQKLY